MLNRSIALLFALPLLALGCTPQVETAGSGDQVSSTDEALSGCHGHAASTIPADETYVLTTFGGPGESGTMSCGSSTRNGSWYYIASRQRFGCGAKVRLTAGGKCVVAQADDYGPDVCVENAAGRPIIDASPKVARALFGVSAAGWSERRLLKAEVVADSTPLGPCDATTADNTPITPDPTPATPAPLESCSSYTLGRDVALKECVQSASDQRWYQCTALGWVKTYADGTGLLGVCTASFPLST